MYWIRKVVYVKVSCLKCYVIYFIIDSLQFMRQDMFDEDKDEVSTIEQSGDAKVSCLTYWYL